MGVRMPMLHSHRQNDVEVLFVESEHDLHPGDLMACAVFNGLRGTEEVHRIHAVWSSDTNLLQIQPRFLVLKQNFHRLGVVLVSVVQPRNSSTTTNCGEAWLISALIVQLSY